MSKEEEIWLRKMEELIPGWCGKYDDYHIIIREQQEYLASIPPLDNLARIAMDICAKYKRQDLQHDVARMLATVAEGKSEDHLRQIAVKWIKGRKDAV